MKQSMKRMAAMLAVLPMLFALAACGICTGQNTSRTVFEPQSYQATYSVPIVQFDTQPDYEPNFEEDRAVKDQVIHIGEIADYGDLRFSFTECDFDQGVFSIKVRCENTGNEKICFNAQECEVYGDGVSMYSAGGTVVNIMPGRMADVQLKAGSDRKLFFAKQVQFDYLDPDHANKWGKITFAVDIPDAYEPENNPFVGTWKNNVRLLTFGTELIEWRSGETRDHILKGTFYNGYSTSTIAYKFIDDNTVLVFNNENTAVASYDAAYDEIMMFDGFEYTKQP